jgi:glycosyltransferase involved in cell wall biosynthesis
LVNFVLIRFFLYVKALAPSSSVHIMRRMKSRLCRPRISVFTRPLDNWKSGSGHHLQEILNAVLDLNQGRLDFTFVHYAHSDNPIYRRDVRELIVPRNLLQCGRIMRKENFDIVHYSPLTIYSPIWRVPGRKVATLHGVEQLLQPQFVGGLELAHERFVVPAYARRMDRIVTVSETSARFFTERFRVSSDRIVVCYNGFSPTYRVMPAGEVTAPARHGIARPYIFHISRFSERKNPWTLLDAFCRFVKDHNAPHSLVCAGSGWNNEKILDRVRVLGMARRYVAPGFLPEQDVAELMNAADAFVFPSLAEGFGMPNIEAMACCAPVITTPGFAIREIVGDAAVVVEDPHDAGALSKAMFDVTTNKQLRARLIERGRQRVSLFSWARSAERLLSVYLDLLR